MGIASSIVSQDPEEVFMKFNQFLILLTRLKLIGMFFGSSLDEFVTIVCGGTRSEHASEADQTQQSTRRRINELSFRESDESKIYEESSGSHKKLDTFEESIFLEGGFVISSFIFTLSWVFKVIGLLLLRQMWRSEKRIKKWKLKYLKYHRKVHHVVVMAVTMDLSFFGSRILLHRRSNLRGVLVKIYCGLNLTLLTLDFIEMASTSLNLKKQRKRKIENKTVEPTERRMIKFSGGLTQKERKQDQPKESPAEHSILKKNLHSTKKTKQKTKPKKKSKTKSAISPQDEKEHQIQQKNKIHINSKSTKSIKYI